MLRLAVISLLLVAACQKGGDAPVAGGGAALRADLEKICDAVVLAGASELTGTDRAYTIADWLGQTIRSAEGKKFLQDWARLGQDKAKRVQMLQSTAAKLGITSCPLVAEWQ